MDVALATVNKYCTLEAKVDNKKILKEFNNLVEERKGAKKNN